MYVISFIFIYIYILSLQDIEYVSTQYICNMYHIISLHIWHMYNIYCEINLSFFLNESISFCYIRLSPHSFEVRRERCLSRLAWEAFPAGNDWHRESADWKVGRFDSWGSHPGTSSKSWRKRSSEVTDSHWWKPVDDKEHRRRNGDPRKIDEGMKLLMIRSWTARNLPPVQWNCGEKNTGSSWTAGRERYNFTTWTPISIGVITYNL